MLAYYLNKAASKEKSKYTPPKAVKEMTVLNQKDAQYVYDLQHKSMREFNDMSVLTRQDLLQRTFNTYEEPAPTDPDESWKWRGVKPTSRNKTISIAAHLISSMMYPNALAQNDKDEEDKAASMAMRDMILWNIDNSDYEMSMLFGVIASCVNPCAYLELENVESMQTIREELENGDISIKEVIDQVVSGIQAEPIAMEEVMISNFYQYSHQKQPFIVRRRLLSYADFEAKYSRHKNFGFVKAGVQVVFNTEDSTFYDVTETQKDQLVEELTFKTRKKDLELCYVNGVYFGKDNVEANRMRNRRFVTAKFGDRIEVPLYNEVKWGYEPIDEKKFYYYKSLVDKLWPDQKKLDKMSRLTVDTTIMAALPSLITTGAPKVDSSIMFPAAVTAFPKDATITPVNTGRDLNALYTSAADAEKNMSESSQDSVRQGVKAQGQQTAYEIARLEQNAIIKEFAIFGRMVGRAVEETGEMMVDLILKYQTVGEAEEITDGILTMPRIKDKTYTLPNQTMEGKKVTKKINFTDKLMGMQMTKDEMMTDSYQKLDKAEETGTYLYEINPVLFAKLSFKINIEPDQMVPKLETFKEERNIRIRNLMVSSPYANMEAVDRDYLFDPLTDGQSDKYMKKAQELGIMPGQNPNESNPQKGSENLLANMNPNVVPKSGQVA